MYYHILGKGSNGVVVQCCKKSTGDHYAMKIIRKQQLLDMNMHNMPLVDLEVRILAAVSHPFVISMAYSFQTPAFGLIVMELAAGMCMK